MKLLRLASSVSLLFVVFAFSPAAHAQAQRTFVSGVGDDANPCSRTAPCRTFAGAISKTALGGEINVLDSAGFNPVTITKSITIDGTGAFAGLSTSASASITINITSATDTAKTVRLRGLSLNGLGTGVNGINVIAANKVTVEDSVIDGFTSNGINLANGGLFVSNTTIRNNGNAGINVGPTGALAGLTDVNLIFNGTGLAGPAGTIVSFDQVVLFGNQSRDPLRSGTPIRQ